MVLWRKTSKKVKFSKKLRKMVEDAMAKNAAKKGRSARNGNAPAPYTKYKKTSYKYSTGYYAWKNSVTGRVQKYQ